MNQNSKNFLIDLRYRKTLLEYNAILLAVGSITLGVLVFSYTVFNDLVMSVILSVITYLIIATKQKEVEEKLLEEINKVKS